MTQAQSSETPDITQLLNPHYWDGYTINPRMAVLDPSPADLNYRADNAAARCLREFLGGFPADHATHRFGPGQTFDAEAWLPKTIVLFDEERLLTGEGGIRYDPNDYAGEALPGLPTLLDRSAEPTVIEDRERNIVYSRRLQWGVLLGDKGGECIASFAADQIRPGRFGRLILPHAVQYPPSISVCKVRRRSNELWRTNALEIRKSQDAGVRVHHGSFARFLLGHRAVTN